MNYVVHFCKNPECNNAWIDEDKYNSTRPPRWKYCPECEKKGFKNKRKINRTMTPEEIESFKQRMAEYRRNKGNEEI